MAEDPLQRPVLKVGEDEYNPFLLQALQQEAEKRGYDLQVEKTPTPKTSTELYRTFAGGVSDWFKSAAPNLGRMVTEAGINISKRGNIPGTDLSSMIPESQTFGDTQDLRQTVMPVVQEKLEQAADTYIPTVAEPETTAGQIGRDFVKFLTGFVPAAATAGVFRGGLTLKNFIKGEAAAAFSSQLGFDPKDPRISNFIENITEDDTFINNAASLIAANPNDPESVARLKMAAEDMTLSAITTPVIQGATKAFSKLRNVKGKKLDDITIDEANTVKESVDAEKLRFDQKYGLDRDFAGNTNLSRLDTPEKIKDVLRIEVDTNKDMYAQARGFQSQKETEQLADIMDLTPEKLLKMDKTIGFENAETALAARNLVLSASKQIKSIADAWKTGKLNDQEKVFAGQAYDQFGAMLKILQGKTAQAGRILNQYNILAKEGPITFVRGMNELQDAATKGNKAKDLEDIFTKIAEIDENNPMLPKIINQGANKGLKYFQEYWINGLLSGLTTHATNILSNSLVGLWNIPERTLAGAIGAVRTKTPFLRGTDPDDRVFMREGVDTAIGMLEGGLDGLRLGYKAFVDEAPSDSASKIDLDRQAIPGTVGRIIRIPGRALMAEDEFFKSVAKRGEVRSLVRRLVNKESEQGLIPNRAAYQARYNELINNPPDDILNKSVTHSQVQTFTNELEGMAKGFQNFASKYPQIRFITPFVRTPVNIMNYALGRSVIAPMASALGIGGRGFKRDMKAGGAKADKAIARIMMGTGASWTAYNAAKEGIITGGGPSDPDLKAELYETGWQPYSFKIGGKYYSYGRLEPLGTLLGIAADYANVENYMTEDEKETTIGLMSASIAKNVGSKTFLVGLTSTAAMLEDPDRYGERFLGDFAGSLVPNIVGQTTRALDPNIKEARGIVDIAIERSGLRPITDELGMTDSLPKLNIYGEERTRTQRALPGGLSGTPIANLVSPILASEETQDKVKLEADRLNLDTAPLRREIKGKKISDEQYVEYAQTTGQVMKMALDQVVQSPAYDNLKDFEKKELLQKIIRKTREKTRDIFEQKFLQSE